MRRRIFNILTAISLVLCVAVAGLWVRSEFRSDGFWYASSDGTGKSLSRHNGAFLSGLFVYSHQFEQARRKPVPQWTLGWHVTSGPAPGHDQIAAEFRRAGFYFLGFGYGTRTSTYKLGTAPVTTVTSKVRAVLVPLWFVMLLLALAPARWLVVKRREIRRRPPHLCKACGYDLRATPDPDGPLLDRCPECGNPTAARATV